MQPELFDEEIDEETLQAVKDMRRFLNFPDDVTRDLFSHRLKITGRGEYIPMFLRQMDMIKQGPVRAK